MPLRKGKANDLERVSQSFDYKHVGPPKVRITDEGYGRWNAMSTALLGVTALWNPATAQRLASALAPIPADETYEWTQTDVRKILEVLESVPLPAEVVIDRLKPLHTATVRAVAPNTAGAVKLSYGKRARYPELSLLSAVRQAGQAIPRGMVLEVPASLLELDNGLLVVALPLHHGRLKPVGRVDEAGEGPDKAPDAPPTAP